jgi:hypothetical protein
MPAKAQPLIFISYKHAEPSTGVAFELRDALKVVAQGLGFSVFIDDDDLRASDLWKEKIDAALGEMTHFVALLNNRYWLSGECRRELNAAIKRFENKRKTKLLFVLVQAMNPAWLVLDEDRSSGKLTSKNPRIKTLGEIHFLGPYNSAKQLIRLDYENPARLSDQIDQLVRHLSLILPVQGGA